MTRGFRRGRAVVAGLAIGLGSIIAGCSTEPLASMVDQTCDELETTEPAERLDLVLDTAREVGDNDLDTFLLSVAAECPALFPDPQGHVSADIALILARLDAINAGWEESPTVGAESFAAAAHPDLGFTEADFACMASLPADTQYRVAAEPDQVSPTPNWQVASGFGSLIDGQVPRGRLYRIEITETTGTVEGELRLSESSLHAAVIDDEAYFFLRDIDC